MSLQAIPDFRVIEECEDWIVVDKPAPLIVHPANNKPEPTLLGGLESFCAYEIANGACLGIITRLDRETSGLVLVAKHTAAARELGMILERREARKEYLAVVHGWPTENEWTCEDRICRAADIGPSAIWVKQVVDRVRKGLRNLFQGDQAVRARRSTLQSSALFPENRKDASDPGAPRCSRAPDRGRQTLFREMAASIWNGWNMAGLRNWPSDYLIQSGLACIQAWFGMEG